MADRLDLHSKLEEIFSPNKIYYQPPEDLKMEYPAIRYSLNKIKSIYANNAKYSNKDCYEIIVIDRLPDNKAIRKILELPYSNYERHYISNNLNHDVLTLYF